MTRIGTIVYTNSETKMFVRWQYTTSPKPEWRRGAEAYAILVEAKRVNGKPQQRHVAYLGNVAAQPERDEAHYRACWWHRMNAKLKKLGKQLPRSQRPSIEAALAKMVKPVTAAEVTAFDRAYTKDWRTKFGSVYYLSWPKGTKGVPARPRAWVKQGGFMGSLRRALGKRR